MNVGEMFAGIGGFRLGLEMANKGISQGRNSENFKGEQSRQQSYNIVWANEWDKYACQIYRKNFGEKELVEADIKTVNTNNIPDIDLLVGGFPCQPHSLAGKRQGFNDERGTVFHEIIRVARAKRPKLLLLENVKGLLSSEQGRAFGTVLEELGNVGYWCEWQVFNSKYFWVPQNRERVFIIGHLRSEPSKQIFPIFSNGGEDCEVGQVAGTLQGGGHSGGLHSNMTAISHSVRSGSRSSIERHSWDLVCVELRQSGFREHRSDGLSPTSTRKMGTGGNNVPIIAGKTFRRLTPIECERLQGFPDNWTQGVSDTQRYKCLGNAVTVNVIQFLGERLLSTFGDKTTSEVKQ